MHMLKTLAALAASALLLTACANQKEPAEKSVAQIEASLTEFKADAEQYAAGELKGVEETVDRLKSELADANYKAVLLQSPNVASSIAALKSSVAKKKAEAEEVLAAAQKEWTELSASVPDLVGRLQARVDALAKTKRIPKGLDKASFESARQEFEAVKSSWAEAGAEFASGLVGDAVRRARAAKAKGEVLLEKFGA